METGENYLFLECCHSPVPALPDTYLRVPQIPLSFALINSELCTSFFHG